MRLGGRLLPATATLFAALIVAYAAQIAAGANWWDAAAADLLRFGANYAPAIAAGEGWRLLASLFLHGGLMHLLVNLVALADIGAGVERRSGAARTFAVFVLSGALGALASAARHSDAISVGASGAIFGLFGWWLVAAGRGGGEAPATLRRRRVALAIYAAVALGGGFLIAGVDNAAHLGGFAGGIVLGALSGRQGRDANAAPRRFWSAALVLTLLVALAPHLFPGDWATPYVEGRRFDRAYRDFALADRSVSAALQGLGEASRAGRLDDAAALARLDDEILPVLRDLHSRWQRDRYADAAVDKERAVWLEYTRLRLEAITALRAAAAGGDAAEIRRFEAKMAAAAQVAGVRQRQGGGSAAAD